MSSVNKLLEDVKVIPVPVVADALIVTSVRFSSSNGWFSNSSSAKSNVVSDVLVSL